MLLQDIQREKQDTKDFKLKQKLLQSVTNVVRGPGQSFLQVKMGILGSSLGAVGAIAVSVFGNYLGFSAQRRNVVNTYRDELAKILQKDRESVTEADISRLAVERPDNPIANDWQIIAKNERAIQSKSIAKNLAISASVITFAAILPALATNMMGFALIMAMTTVIDIVAENVLEKWQGEQRITGASFSRAIQNEMSKGIVSPAKLFEYSVQVQPTIAEAIRKNLNEEYAGLSIEHKQEVLNKLGLAETMQKIADDLNHGKIRPSELPFLLAGVDSPSTSFASYKSMIPKFSQAPIMPQASHAQTPDNKIHAIEHSQVLAPNHLVNAV